MHAQLRRNYKIGFLLPYLAAAGGVRRNFELANRLSELGHEVAIYSDSTQEQWFPLKVRVFKLSELQNSTDAIFTGWPLFEEKIYNFIRAEKKFWLMQGYVPEYDTRFIIDPQFVKIAASSYLYKTAEKLGVKAYKCIGAVNFDHFYPVKVERKNFALYNPLKNGKIIEEMCGRLGLEIKPLFNIKQEYLKYIYSC
ncbi:MAG: hypothetical protein MUF15_28125, partial [Acidobacteria bacterium]|nr:hypothetical protein [Acidobacteriota bacterium]